MAAVHYLVLISFAKKKKKREPCYKHFKNTVGVNAEAARRIGIVCGTRFLCCCFIYLFI